MNEEIVKELTEGGIDVDGISKRLQGMESLIKRLLLKFPNEQCYQDLVKAMNEQDYKQAFAHAHNLKGVAANLEMHPLLEYVSELVEKLRFSDEEDLKEKQQELSADMQKIGEAYQKVTEAILRALS